MQIHNAIITGSFSYNGADLSNVTSSNAYSASLSSRTTDLESTSSVLVGASSSFSSILTSVSSSQQQISSSFLTLTASFNAVSASQQQISASYIALSASYNTFSGSASTRVTQIEQVYATTGSNSFRATQSITGSLTVTGQIIAQTINVQQVTSSIIYSSGSNNFGNQLANTQTFTGSVNITGSSHAIFGNVGIGTNAPTRLLDVSNTSGDSTIVITSADATGQSSLFYGKPSDANIGGVLYNHCNNQMSFRVNDTTKMSITSTGNVGIGTCTPARKLTVVGTIAAILSDANDVQAALSATATAVNLAATYGSTGTYLPLTFSTNSDERMRITSGGNVLIGTTCIYNTANFIVSAGSGASSSPYMGIFNCTTSPTADASARLDLGFLGGASNYVASGGCLGAINFMGQGNDAGYGGASIITVTTCGGNTCRYNHAVDMVFTTKPTGNTGAPERMRITSAGNVGIDATTPYAKLHIGTAANNENNIFFTRQTTTANVIIGGLRSSLGPYWGDATSTSLSEINLETDNPYYKGAISFRTNNSDATANRAVERMRITSAGITCFGFTVCAPCFATISDYRMKSNVRPIEGLSIIMNTKPYKFEYNYDCSTSFGMIAHELQDALPEAVFGQKDGEVMQGVDYMKLLPITIKAIQEQQCTICSQATMINQLKTCLGIN